MKIGIDAGGTLIKIVEINDSERTFRTELSSNLDKSDSMVE